MRSSISQLIATLFLLFTSFAFATDATSTSVTVLTTTRTVYRVVTETHTGTPPLSTPALHTTVGTLMPTHHTNSTGITPTVGVPQSTGNSPAPTAPGTGAAANMQVPAAALAGVMLAMLAL